MRSKPLCFGSVSLEEGADMRLSEPRVVPLAEPEWSDEARDQLELVRLAVCRQGAR